MKNIDLNKFLNKQPVLKEIDLSIGEKSTHPEIKTDGTSYLALYDGRYQTVSFGTQWYGLTSHGGHCGQYNKPGYNSSSWERLWEIVESDNITSKNTISFKEIKFIYKNKKIYKTKELMKYESILEHNNNYTKEKEVGDNQDIYYIDNPDFMDYYNDLHENNDYYYDEESDSYFRDMDKYAVDNDYIVLINNNEKYIIETIYKTYSNHCEKYLLKDLNGKVLFEDFSSKHITDFIIKKELELLKTL
jgi:hypothetical protein